MPARTRALDSKVFGVDVQSGDVRGDSPSYALVILDGGSDGTLDIDRDVVSHRKLCRLIERDEPALLATDNMYELAADKADLVRFLGALPGRTTLVQVTGAEQPEPLSRVASRHGVPYGKDPMEEAEAAARLAAANIGSAVTAFTQTTEVRVSRGRSTGKGGWSEDRFTRRIHGSVRRRARDIESTLEEAGLDYDREVTEKYGGFSQAVFTVEATPDEIPVRTGRDGDVRVEFERERRDGIAFEPLAHRRDHVIVGIDPGTTTAVAIVGLEGEVLDTWSTRTGDGARLVEWIVERGRPIIVAADVTPMPESVEKVRRSFDAVAWTPESDLPVDDKLHRTRSVRYDNDHERDAAAAALFAHDGHVDQFERIARKTPPTVEHGAVIATVLREDRSVESVLADHQEDASDGTDHREPEPVEPSPERRRIREQAERIDRLESHVEDLERTLADREATIEEYESELEQSRREERREVRERREVTRLKREIDRLERELDAEREEREALEGKLDRLKELWKLDHADFADIDPEKRGLVPIKPVAKFTNDALRFAEEEYGLAEDDVILLRDASGAGRSTAETLAEVSPRLVLRRGGLSDVADEVLFEAGIPVESAESVPIESLDELVVTREEAVNDAIDRWKRRATERERERTADLVDRIVSEHRASDA